MEAVTLQTILSDVGVLVTQALVWMKSAATLVTNTPILTLFVIAVPLVGLGVGLLKRLIHSN